MTELILSIIIPCYNHGKYILDAINSVKQSQPEYAYEIIVVNDGSNDPFTLQVLDEIENEKILILNQKNQGLAAARNNGITVSKGKYILPLDSDNKVHKNYLTQAFAILENDASIDVVYGNPIFLGDRKGTKKIGEFRLSKMLEFNYIDACAIYKKNVWEMAGGYDETMPAMGNEDWEFWIHAYLNGARFYYLDDVCYYYRVLSNSMSVTTTKPGFEANKDFILKKHMYKVIDQLIIEQTRYEHVIDYIKKYKLRSIAKVVLGRKFYGYKF